MNSEVTLEQLREARVLEISGDPANGFIIAEACDEYFSVAVSAQQLAALGREMIALSGVTTPPASGGVVGVPREPTMGRGSMMDAGVAAARSHKEAKDIDPTFGMVRAIYAAMLSAAPKQAMGWRPIESAPRDGTWIMLAGGKIDYGWYAEQPPFVVGQWTTYLNGGTHEGRWQFAWYDGGYYGEYEAPTQWRPAPLPSPPEKAP